MLGALAGPLYVLVALVQTATRKGYKPARHAWNMLANGDLGWIHITNLIVSGVLVIAGATGLRAALRAGPGVTWAPRLLAIYGAGMVLAGMFPADAGRGSPPGSPQAAETSWHGVVHSPPRESVSSLWWPPASSLHGRSCAGVIAPLDFLGGLLVLWL